MHRHSTRFVVEVGGSLVVVCSKRRFLRLYQLRLYCSATVQSRVIGGRRISHVHEAS